MKDIVNKSYNIDFNGLDCSYNCKGLNADYSFCLVFETDLYCDVYTGYYERCESCINKWGKDE